MQNVDLFAWSAASMPVRLLTSVPIVIVGYIFIKRVHLHRNLSYLIHSDKGYQFHSHVQISSNVIGLV